MANMDEITSNSDYGTLVWTPKKRGFEEASPSSLSFKDVPTKMPYRSTLKSAGYDFESKEDVVILPGESHVFTTDVKAYMKTDEYLAIHPRGGFGFGGKHLMLTNTVGIIDADFYNSEDGDGNIKINLYNNGSTPQEFKIGDRIAQGIFSQYLVADGDISKGVRTGGFHSTGK